MVDQTEKTLIQQVLNGKKECYRPLVEAYQKKVYLLAFSFLGNNSDAQDIAQESFLTAYNKLRNLKDHDKFGSWLYGITRNLCFEAIRKQKVEPDLVDTSQMEKINNVVSMLPENERGENLVDVILLRMEHLPEKYKVLLRLKYLEDYSYQEISEMLDVPVDIVRSRLFEGRRLLRDKVEKSRRVDYGQ